jgi:hypothetical protein
MGISVTDPISRAIARAKFITFQPFDFGKWFVLGFVAWISTLGEGGGGGNFNFNNNGFSRRPMPFPRPGVQPPAPPNPFHDVVHWIVSNPPLAILIALGFMVVAFGIGLVLLWVSSRGKLMFLRAVATNTTEVRAPWAQFRDLGNSLFGFRVCLMAIGFGIMILTGVASLSIAFPDIRAHHFGLSSTVAIIFGVLLLVPSMIILALVNWAIGTFGTIIMYARGVSAVDAWREFRLAVLPGNTGTFILFLLMQIVLGIGYGIIAMLAGCVTCCIGFLPYISTVVTLPVAIFWRCYSIYFFEQFGPQYAIIQEPPPTYGFPVAPYPPPQQPPPNYPYPQ